MNHRNSQKRLHVDDGIFAITVNTKDRYPYFREEIFCELFIEQLRLCKQMRKFRLYGFALMPDHFHMMIHPEKGENISRVMHYFKKHISRNINITMGYFEGVKIGQNDLQESEDIHPRFQELFMPSLEGEDGYPRPSRNPPPSGCLHPPKEQKHFGENLHSRLHGGNGLDNHFYRNAFIKKHHSLNSFPKFSWQSSFHDHLIRNEQDFQNQLEYIWWNPEKHGIIKDYTSYPYSSFLIHQDLMDLM